MGRGANVSLFGLELDVISFMIIIFFLVWVIWGMIQFALSKAPDDPPNPDNEAATP